MLKTVTTELRYAHDVISSGETHSPRVAAAVDPLLGLFLEGGRINGTGDVQTAITGWIRQEVTLVEGAEKTHLAERRKLDQIREVRDADEQELYRKCLTVRTTVESAAGKGKSAQLERVRPARRLSPAPETVVGSSNHGREPPAFQSASAGDLGFSEKREATGA